MKARTILLIIFGCCLLVGGLLFLGWKSVRPFHVPSGAMAPAIPEGSYVFVDELAYSSADEVERGDVIIFDIVPSWNGGSEESSVFVFRVMGVPGDDFKVDELGRVTIDGKRIEEKKRGERHSEFQKVWYDVIPMEEPFGENIFQRSGGGLFEGRIPEGRIPEGKFFVMGDSRGSALDSRFWGFVPWEDVRGKVRGYD